MALSTTNNASLTQEQVVTVLTTPLEQASVFLNAGPVIYDTTGPLRIPSLPSSKTESLGFTGENELIPEVEYDFPEVKLLPSSLESVKTVTRFSNELARASVVSIDAALQQRLLADQAGRLDAQFLSADGDGITTPRGLFAWEGTQDVAVDGSLTIDAVLEGQGLALAAHVNTESLALFIAPADYMSLRALKDADGRYLVQPDVQAGGLVSPILGSTVNVSNRVPAGRAALVDMSKIAVARDASPTVTLLTERYAEYDQLALRVVNRMDVAPLTPEAIVTFSGITAA